MEVRLATKFQQFSPPSSILLTSTSSSLLNLPKFRPICREFLGSSHNLRPPGFRSRRKCKRLGFQIHSPRFVFRTSAALDAQSMILVVSVVAVSALTVVYLHYSNRKERKKENAKGISEPLGHTDPLQGKTMLNLVVKNEMSSPVDVQVKASAKGNIDKMKEIVDIAHDSEYKSLALQSRETTLVHVGTLTTDASVPYATSLGHNESCLQESELHVLESGALSVGLTTVMTDMICEGRGIELGSKLHEESFPADALISTAASSANGLTSSRQYQLSYHESKPHVLESDTLSFSLSSELGDLFVGGQREIEVGSELPKLKVKDDLISTSVPVNGVQTETSELEHTEDVEIHECNGVPSEFVVGTEFIREELYTFFESKEYATSSVQNSMKPVASYTALGSKHFSSHLSSSTFEGMKISTKDILINAENSEGKIPPGHQREGHSKGRKDLLENREEPSIDKERKVSSKGNPIKSFQQLQLNKEEHRNDLNYSSQQISAYNRFLRQGRLLESLEKLEYLERKGLLDMNNVYHAGFYRACKTKRAVKEAFRFTNLIPNPTLSTFNMLMSVCASSQDLDGAFRVLQLVQTAGLKVDCKLYTTLISTCAKSRKVDLMFEVFHEMVNSGVEPNVHTYGALIDGCAKAGQVAKAFGAYGIMRSKNVKPDRVVFNALITACGQSGAVDRAFDVLSEMRGEIHPIDPDHVTVGALLKACVNSGQVDRAREVYKMMHQFNIKGTPEVYTIAINSCSDNGDWKFALSVYEDMAKKGIPPDEMFISALIDVAGHAKKLDAAFEILEEAQKGGIDVGTISYSSLMGACSNVKNWQRALELYEEIKSLRMKPVVSTMNALITALCDGDQLPKALEILSEMEKEGLSANIVTFSILIVASEKKDDLEVGRMLLSQAKKNGLSPNLVMCRCLTAMCYRRFEKACRHGEPLLSINSGRLLIDSEWTSLALMVYRETITAGVVPTMDELSQVLGCLRLLLDSDSKSRLIENVGVITDTSKGSNLCSLIDGFGEYDPRAFSLLEEAASLGIVPCVSFKESPIVVDVRNLPIYTAEVYLLTVLKGLKHRLAAGARLPNLLILLPVVKTEVHAPKGEKTINVAGRITQAISALLRRLRLAYLGNESFGKIRINGVVIKKWFQPKLSSFSGKPTDYGSSNSRLGKGITNQQRNIRTGNLSLE